MSLLMLLVLSSLQAQRRKGATQNKPKLPDKNLQEALATYNFTEAEQLLNDEIEILQKSKQPTTEQEQKLLWLQKAQIKLNAVEQVTYVDSIVVPLNRVLDHIPLSPESGRVMRTNDYFGTTDNKGCTLFQSQMGDQIIFAQNNGKGMLNLYEQTIYSDGSKSNAEPLAGLFDDKENQNYPFVMTDGTTIYFAAQGPESLGGYDIFMSRYDAELHRYLTPENIGMPFNSPANDYLYIVDENNHLGWFVTDRNQPAGKVCIYAFIPNDTRKVYVPEEMEIEKLRRLGRLTSIKETWSDANEVRRAQFRLREAKNTKHTENEHEFEFIVTDKQIYHQRKDFRSQQALQLFDLRVKNMDELYKATTTLSRLRTNYYNASEAQRVQLKGEILMLEKSEESLMKQIKHQENEIRRLELGL